jgi:glycosyltransferase involved in cell wall biosynthesis
MNGAAAVHSTFNIDHSTFNIASQVMEPNSPKTLYVTTGLHGGGAERLLTNMLLQQGDRDRITVVSLLPGGIFRRTIEDAGIRVIDLDMYRYRDVVRAAFSLARLIRAEQPSLVYGWMYHANLLAMLSLLLAGRPRTRLIWAIFCTDALDRAFLGKRRVIRGISAFLSRWVSGIIYNAEEARDYHRGIGFCEPHSVVISNCVDPEVFRHDPRERGALRAELGIKPDEVVVTVIARVNPMKDWETVRQAVRDLPAVVTVAIGKGTNELPPQPGFIGLGWRDDVVRILSAADIFLLGSAFGEGASLALGEAMLCGLPCVVTDVGGNSALVGDGGIVVEPRNPAAIRKAILQLAADREHREALGRMARARAVSAESSDSILRRLRLLSPAVEGSP